METETQTFNILCVSKIGDAGTFNGSRWHTPSFGKAHLRTAYDEVRGVKIPKVLVKFGEKEYKLLKVDVGLTGSCVALFLKPDSSRYKFLKLYTDQPAVDEFTVEDVLREAEEEIKHKGYNIDKLKERGWPVTSEQD